MELMDLSRLMIPNPRRAPKSSWKKTKSLHLWSSRNKKAQHLTFAQILHILAVVNYVYGVYWYGGNGGIMCIRLYPELETTRKAMVNTLSQDQQNIRDLDNRNWVAFNPFRVQACIFSIKHSFFLWNIRDHCVQSTSSFHRGITF